MVEALSNFASFLGEIFKKVNIESMCIAGAVGIGLHYYDVDTNLCIIAGLLTIPFISLIIFLWNRNKAKRHYKETLKKEQAETIKKNDGFVDFLESYFITLDFRIQYAILELSKRNPVGNKYMYAVQSEDSLYPLLKFASEKLVFNPISSKLNLKNCQNIGSEGAAENAAFMYSIIESCRLNNKNPYQYLLALFRKAGEELDALAKRALMPDRWVPDC